MLTQRTIDPRPSGEALTHRACLTASPRSAQNAARRPSTWVQVRRHHREGPYVLCGQLIELRSGETEWFKVETLDGAVWAEGKNVRMCSGDGRCTCEGHGTEGSPC
jgi:hypothetical protein